MSELVTATSLKEFFKVLLEQVISSQRLRVGDTTEFYLVNLLAEFAEAERLFTEEEDGRKDHEPLALMYHRALAQEREQQIRTLRRIGDVSLYKVGFFGESLRGGPVGPDYYIDMGGAAYGQVASLSSASGFSSVYRELCEKFRPLVEVLEEIAARGMVANGAGGTLKVYESWARTGKDRLERVLVDAGFFAPKTGLPN
jgi:hypothetical protein